MSEIGTDEKRILEKDRRREKRDDVLSVLVGFACSFLTFLVLLDFFKTANIVEGVLGLLVVFTMGLVSGTLTRHHLLYRSVQELEALVRKENENK